jgi:RimJ/RimL family protein N-acetyltransferase
MHKRKNKMKFEAVTLEGKFVRLEPLNKGHREGLCEAIEDGELWNLYVTLVPPLAQIDSFLENAQTAFETGDGLTFATIDKTTGKIAGSTRFMKANLPNKRVEIGFTFLGKMWQKTGINTEAKLFMLTHAFEVMDLNRVEFLTDYFNNTSRNAILRLGAKEEGLLRSHMVMPNGRVRDSMLYSIVKHEWNGVKLHLNGRMKIK